MQKIIPSDILYIKLGREGCYEKECIDKGRIIIDFKEINHDFCVNGKWDKAKDQMVKLARENTGWGNSKTLLNQLKYFYESKSDVLWITFFSNKLWWCFVSHEVYLDKENRKYRNVINDWKSIDVNGKDLVLGKLSGKLLKTQAYRGAICKVEAKDYLIKKINCEDSIEKIQIKDNLDNLKNNLTKLISNLHWDDFEVLVDLIFSKLGWIRVGALGKTQKDIDLDLVNPLTSRTAIVQIKSQLNTQEFNNYLKKFKEINADEKFFVINSGDNFSETPKSDNIKVYFGSDIAGFVIKCGLIGWVLNKAT